MTTAAAYPATAPEPRAIGTRRRLALATLVVAVATFVVGFWKSHAGILAGVETRDVWIPVETYALHGRLYRAPAGGEGPHAGVLVLHGYLGNLDVLEVSFAVELARRGFTVLAVDYPGHGRSGAGTRSADPPSEAPAAARRPAVRAALAFLRAQPDVDPARVGILGNSEGAKAAAQVAADDRTVRATVYLAGPVDGYLFSNDTAPRNTLLIYGDHDRATPPEPPRFARDLPWVATPGRIDGDFAAGNARQLIVVPGQGHFSILFDAVARAEAVRWLDAALRGGDGRGVTVRAIPLAWIPLAYLGVLLGLHPLFFWLEPRVFRGRPRAPARRSGNGVWAAGAIAVRAALCVAGVLAARYVLPWWDAAFDPLPISGARMVIGSLWAIGTGLVALLPVAVVGPRMRRLPGEIRDVLRPEPGRAVAFGALAAVYVILVATVLALHYFDLVPTARRLTMLVALAVLAAPPLLVWEVWLRVVVPGATSWGPAAAVVGTAALTSAGVGAFVLGTPPYFAGITVVFLAIVCLALGLPTIATLHVRRRGTIVLAVVFESLLIGWIVAAACPFYY